MVVDSEFTDDDTEAMLETGSNCIPRSRIYSTFNKKDCNLCK